MNLVTEIGKDRFAKVKILIQELIERLQQQAIAETNQKGWCDKAETAAKQKRDYAVEEVRELNGRMAELEALRDQLNMELGILHHDINNLNISQAQAGLIRDAEKMQNAAIVTEARAGQEAVEDAVDVLIKFYKTQDKAKIAFVQPPDSRIEGYQPGDAKRQAPDTGFASNETYKGSGGSAQGVIGMLEVIASDFQRTADETEQAEDDAASAYVDFLAETGKSKAQKMVAQKQKTKQRNNAVEQLSTDQDNLDSQITKIQDAIKELLKLQTVCNAQQTYEERVANRLEEIEALKKALCIFNAYEEYGPDGAATSC